MIKKYLSVLIISIIFFSCSDKEKKADVSIETIVVNPAEATETFLSDFVDEIRFVKLSTEKNSLIGYIDKVRIVEGKIFVFDSERAKGVFVYDMDGNSLYNIKRQGSGPGEFNSPYDFGIDTTNNSLIIYDDANIKFVHYDLDTGQFIKDQKLDFRISSFWITKGTYILFLNNRSFKNIRNNILITDKELNILDSALEMNPKLIGYHYRLPRNFSENNGTIYFTGPIDYNIYKLSEDEFSEYLKLEVGDNKMPKEFYNRVENSRDRLSTSENSIRSFSNYYEDSSIRYFVYFRGTDIYYRLEFKGSKKVYHGLHNEIIKDMGSGPFIGWADDYFNKTLVYHETPTRLYDYLKNKKQTMNSSEWEAFKFENKELILFSQEATLDSNPYIILLKLKN